MFESETVTVVTVRSRSRQPGAGPVDASEEQVIVMTKRFDEEIRVERDTGIPSAFEWRGRRYEVADVIGKWRIEGRWWDDGRDREYWRVEARGGAVWDLYFDRQRDLWHMERLWD